MKTKTSTSTPVIRMPLTGGGYLEIPNPPVTREVTAELDRLELLANERAERAGK